ncbi:MAG: TM2 domain-containing protein [Armatimonadota bacterium]
MKCPRCGTENLDERVYCWRCMAPLKSGAMGAVPSAIPTRAQPPTPRIHPTPTTIPAGAGEKSYLVAALLAWFLGFLGIDRFYLGYIGLGVVKLLTCGLCGIWQLIDFVLIIAGVMRDADGNELRRAPNDWIIVLVIVVATIILQVFFGGFAFIVSLLQHKVGAPVDFKPVGPNL